jgi:hypothetical protein
MHTRPLIETTPGWQTMKEYTDVFVLGNKIIGKDKRTGHYVKIAGSEKDDMDIKGYDQVAVNRSKGKVTVTERSK